MGCLTAVRIDMMDGCDVQVTTRGMAILTAKRRGSSGCASSATRRDACVAAVLRLVEFQGSLGKWVLRVMSRWTWRKR